MIRIINGDLMESSAQYICHQVNCQGVMGSGVAKQIRAKWPEVFDKYKKVCDDHSNNREALLGQIQGVRVNENTAIINIYGIIIDTVNFTDISVDAETAAAIQKKVTAQQELELANIEAQTAKVNANKEKEVAQIAAEKAIIEAEAEAEVIRIVAEAEADANRKIAASLTSELIEKIKYEQWDGKMPTVSGAGAIVSIDGVN